MTMTQQEIVARAIHAADATHKHERWGDVKGVYLSMAEAAMQAMPAPAYPLSNPAREYAEECFLDAIHHAVTRHPEISFEDVLAALDNVKAMARETFDNAQPDDMAPAEYIAQHRAWEQSK